MFVHPDNNPGNIDYNSSLYMFVKSWFLPTEEGSTMVDTWLRIPALKSENLSGGYSYTSLNINVDTISMMVVTEEGTVLKASSVPPGKVLPSAEFEAVKRDALDVSEWERTRNTPWNYRMMFDSKSIRERYQLRYGNNTAPYGAVLSDTSISYNSARRAVMSRPCNCGKK